MGVSRVGSIVLLFQALVILQSFWAASSSFPKDVPELHQFFHYHDLKLGRKMPLYFPILNPSRFPPFLSRKEAESIPFSLSHLPEALKLFSIPAGSTMGKAMERTLGFCEIEPEKRNHKFCATSLEYMEDSTHAMFGRNVDLKVGVTKHFSKGSTSLLQNYTILEKPKQVLAPKVVGCHPLAYPYVVYHCHSQDKGNKLFKLSLVGENGWRVETFGICHMDTSTWNADHAGFLVLKTRPGESPVCHIFPAHNIVWFPAASELV